MKEHQFKARPFDRKIAAEPSGVNYVEKRDPTVAHPFKLSQSNFGSKVPKKLENSQERDFNTSLERVSKRQDWPQSPAGNRFKRRSQSQEFKRDSKIFDHSGYRVTFTSKPGQRHEVPLRTAMRAAKRCESCHNHLETIPEAQTGAFKYKKPSQFVLKKAMKKPTVPQKPKLNTDRRSKEREEYMKRTEEWRNEVIKKQREERQARAKRLNQNGFNLYF